jgi:hypothetical protein
MNLKKNINGSAVLFARLGNNYFSLSSPLLLRHWGSNVLFGLCHPFFVIWLMGLESTQDMCISIYLSITEI